MPRKWFRLPDFAFIARVFIGHRASIAEIPLLRRGYRTSTLNALQGGETQKKGRGYPTQLAMLRHQKTHSVQWSALGKWGRTQMGSDGLNRIVTGFYFFSPVGVRLAPLKTHDFKGF